MYQKKIKQNVRGDRKKAARKISSHVTRSSTLAHIFIANSELVSNAKKAAIFGADFMRKFLFEF